MVSMTFARRVGDVQAQITDWPGPLAAAVEIMGVFYRAAA
jgi:hypothetical protein